MALDALRSLFVSLGLEVDEAKFATAKAAVDALELGLEKVVEVAERVADSFVEMVKGTAEYADKTIDTAAAAGLTTDQLQELEWAAVHSGLGMEEVAMAAERLSRAMYDAKKGGEESILMFSRLGVRVTDAHGRLRDTNEVFGDVAEAFKKMPPGAERTAKAMEIFGRSGAKMVPLLIEGKLGLAEFAEAAHRAGVVMSEEDLKAAKEFAEDLDSLKVSLRSVSHEIGVGLIKSLDPLLKRFQAWFELNRKWLSQAIEEKVVKPLTAAIDGLAAAFDWVVKNSDWLAAALRVLAVFFLALKVGAIETGVAMVAKAVAAAAAWLAASWPLVLLGVLLAGLYLVADELKVTLEGGDSVMSRIAAKYGKLYDDLMHSKPGDTPLEGFLRMVLWLLDQAIQKAQQLYVMWKGPEAMAAQMPAAPGGARFWFDPTGRNLGAADAFAGAAQAQAAAVSPFVAAPAAGGAPNVASASFGPGSIVVNAAPGQSAQQVGQSVGEEIERRWNEKLSAALPVVR